MSGTDRVRIEPPAVPSPRLRDVIDLSFGWPLIRIAVVIEILIVANALNGRLARADGLALAALVAAGVGAVILLPAIVARFGVAPEGRGPRPDVAAPIEHAALAEERRILTRARNSERDLEMGLRRRLREDLSVLLRTRHRLDLDDPRHRDAVIDLIGDEAWALVSGDRPRTGDGRGLDRREIERVIAATRRVLTASAGGPGHDG